MKPRIFAAAAAAGAALLLSACVVVPAYPRYTAYGYGGDVTPPMPAPIYEPIPVAPAPYSVWISGRWVWGGARWTWHGGYWQRRGY